MPGASRAPVEGQELRTNGTGNGVHAVGFTQGSRERHRLIESGHFKLAVTFEEGKT